MFTILSTATKIQVMFKLGFRAHDFGRFSSFEELGETIRGYAQQSLIQLALKKSVPSFKDISMMDEKDALDIRGSLLASGVSIAVIGCYINPIHPDPDERKKHIARFVKLLELSSALGCRIVATETGSANPDCSYSEETKNEKHFSILCRTVETLLKKAEENNAIVALEPVARQHTVDSSEKMRRVLDIFQSKCLKVVLDPVNLVPWTGIPTKNQILQKDDIHTFIDDITSPIKDDVVAIHAKNYVLIDHWKKGDLPLLDGVFDWSVAIPCLKKAGIDDIPFLLENMKPSTLKETMDYLTPLL